MTSEPSNPRTTADETHAANQSPEVKTRFIELTGKTLLDLVNEGEIDFKQLHDAGVRGDSILRINRYGEIELRSRSGWILVGGLIGVFEERLMNLTGLEWCD